MKILEVVTEHTGPFKILFEVLKDMISETPIEFICDNPQKHNTNKDNDEIEETEETEEDTEQKKKTDDKDCMKLMAVDTSQTVMIHLKLDAGNFTKFVCRKKKITIGLNLGSFYKLIKSMGKNDILSLGVEHDDRNHLEIKIDNPEELKNSVFKLKLLDIDQPKIQIPEMTFDAVITMNAQEFHKLCRDMHQIAPFVEIQCLTDKIIFICKGSFAQRVTTYKTDDKKDQMLVSIQHSSKISKDAPLIVQGIYELKNLVIFSKFSSLCNDIEIYMKNNFPLIIKYTVATLGRIILCLSPVQDIKADSNNEEE